MLISVKRTRLCEKPCEDGLFCCLYVPYISIKPHLKFRPVLVFKFWEPLGAYKQTAIKSEGKLMPPIATEQHDYG